MAIDYRQWGMVGVGVGIVSYVLAWVYSWIFGEAGAGSITFATLDVNVRQQITSGVDKSIGTQVLNLFGGNFNGIAGGMFGAAIMAIIGAVLLVIIGRFVYEYVPFGKTANTRLIAVLLYGSIIGGAIVSFWTGAAVKIPTVNAIVTMAIYFFIVALVYSGLSNTQFGRFFPIPQ